MKRITALLTGLMIVAGLNAQTTGKITGSVLSPEKNPVASATVELLYAKDSSRYKVAVSDQAGKFGFENLPAAKYLLQVSAVGHEKGYSTIFLVEAGAADLELEPVMLVKRSQDLKSVTVSATKPLVEQKIDRMVVNVEAFVSNTGANALEVLEKSPGVQVDKDGNISLKGKQGVIVMLDGRPAYLS